MNLAILVGVVVILVIIVLFFFIFPLLQKYSHKATPEIENSNTRPKSRLLHKGRIGVVESIEKQTDGRVKFKLNYGTDIQPEIEHLSVDYCELEPKDKAQVICDNQSPLWHVIKTTKTDQVKELKVEIGRLEQRYKLDQEKKGKEIEQHKETISDIEKGKSKPAFVQSPK